MAKQSVAKQSVKSTAKSLSPKSPSRTKIGGARPKPSSKKGLRAQGQQYVGIELHRRRSVIVRLNDASEVLGVTKVANDPAADVNGHRRERPRPRGGPGSLLRGWYWAAHLLRAQGCQVHLPTPSACTGTAGLDETGRSVVYYCALLVNVGCHSDAPNRPDGSGRHRCEVHQVDRDLGLVGGRRPCSRGRSGPARRSLRQPPQWIA